MNHIFFTVFRRLRKPLITLIVVYAVSILGLVLIPGVDDQGRPWQMSFFHAFYFVSFMGSTIGFGEVPYAFTDAQRMWTLVCIYATVVAWLYGIGKVLGLFQDQAFIRLLRRFSFVRRVERMHEPFYLVCGYGITGRLVVSQLIRRGIAVVVVDIERDRIDELESDPLPLSVPGLCADASDPEVLRDAGLQSRHCLGVLALTNHDSANLAIAIATKLLGRENTLPVICRSEAETTTNNLASFGTDRIIDPFVTYANYLGMAIHSPYKHLIYDWLTNPEHRSRKSAYQKTQGRWVICGYGRLGRALEKSFEGKPVSLTMVDDNPKPAGLELDFVQGLGTEAVTLKEARIEGAVGLVAGTGNDANNLSIIMTALELNPKLMTVARQNSNSNASVFHAAQTDLVMEPARIIANHILALIKTPLLPEFVEQLTAQEERWCRKLLNQMNALVGQNELDSWDFDIDTEDAPAVLEDLLQGQSISLRDISRDPRERGRLLTVMPLMLKRDNEYLLLPEPQTPLMPGDRVLFCGDSRAYRQMGWTLANGNVLDHVLGKPLQGGWIARQIRQWRAERNQAAGSDSGVDPS
ncbi:potassium transporter TrkA [Motiliproteus coralliicola]|uniref:Potassium transporter TrkA n=1 Tax=Motiliproteus coralliicola TaxID=2283196 RepID=A0A369WQ07_9GAMM|nr:NAD-binding protein [Motiliproteus coralliicola]RDE24160.1 potassium transporter TrkA [Motiliproteus coralliicola]